MKAKKTLLPVLLLAGVAIVLAVVLYKKGAQVTINGKTWNVEVVTTRRARAKGLSGRDSLPDDAGMLFIYPRPQLLTFGMKDCPIPLDIAFIDENMRVINTHTMSVEPGRIGHTYYSSNKPAQFVLEVPAGALGRAGVRAGSKVTFSGDIPDPAKAEDSP